MNNRLVYLFGGLFLIFSPLSVATDLGATGPMKYLRLGTTVLIVLLGLSGPLFRGRVATLAFLPFVVVWSISPIWGPSPLWGLLFKGMFTLTFLSGATLALSPRTLPNMESGLRLLGPIASLAALLVLFEYVTNPEGASVHGRMSVGGLNANMLAQTAAPLAVLCSYLALYGTRPLYKRIAVGAIALLFMILLLTGSRGGIMMSLIGCGIVTVPVARKPGVLLLAGGLLFGCGYVALELLNVSGEVRAIDDLTKDTRSSIWSMAFKRFAASPVLGQGWLVQRGTSNKWLTVQSAYVQVLAETGIVGISMLVVAIVALVPALFKARNAARRVPKVLQLWYLCAACLTSSLFHGLVESSMISGTSLTPLLLGFGVGLLDRLPVFARQDTGAQGGTLRWAWIWVPAETASAPALVDIGNGLASAIPDSAGGTSGA